MYKSWLRRLYTEPNPYTGIPLKDDPAVAIIQIQNEDSLLFYTEQQIRGKSPNIFTSCSRGFPLICDSV